jgi:hypothetical protein
VRTPHAEGTPLPVSNVTVSRGIGILEDGKSLWPGLLSTVQGQGTWRVTPTANNTFIVRGDTY